MGTSGGVETRLTKPTSRGAVSPSFHMLWLDGGRGDGAGRERGGAWEWVLLRWHRGWVLVHGGGGGGF